MKNRIDNILNHDFHLSDIFDGDAVINARQKIISALDKGDHAEAGRILEAALLQEIDCCEGCIWLRPRKTDQDDWRAQDTADRTRDTDATSRQLWPK